METFTCRICKTNFANKALLAYETRYGWNDEFKYIRCPHCGTIQIIHFPEDIGRYYSSAYYSMKKMTSTEHNNIINVLFRRLILKYKVEGKSYFGKLLSNAFKDMYLWVQPNMFSFKSKILDVGCGSGDRILKLAQCGFFNVSGIDPFLDEDVSYTINRKHSISIKKKQLYDVDEKYDCIMLHHVIEHMPDPCSALNKLSTLLNDGGTLLIALPVLSKFGWEQYGMLSLPFADAPRHYHIFEYDFFVKLVQSYGFELVVSDFHFSERVLHDAYGNYSEYVQSQNHEVIKRKIIDEKDSGIVVLYFKLQSRK